MSDQYMILSGYSFPTTHTTTSAWCFVARDGNYRFRKAENIGMVKSDIIMTYDHAMKIMDTINTDYAKQTNSIFYLVKV